MDKRDRELLDKQLWSVDNSPRNNGATIALIIAVFLAGVGIGDILSKAKLANPNYAAMARFAAEIPHTTLDTR